MISRVAFIGSKNFGLEILRTVHQIRPDSIIAVVTYDDKDDARSALVGYAEFCSEINVPLYVAINRHDAEAALERLQPEFCLVVGWYWFLSQSLLDKMPYGAVGLHNSLLPKYRGGSPLVWALINGEEEVGCSLFSFTHEMDAGDVWLQCVVPLTQEDNIGSAQQKIEKAICEQLRLQWPNILDNIAVPIPQNNNDATYCSQRFADDGEIDWSRSSYAIHNLIRAQTPPYPGAFTTLGGRRVILLSAKRFSYPYYGIPGQVARIVRGEGVYIICGDSRAIIVSNVSIEGRVCAAEDVFISIKYRLGTQ